MEAAGYDVVLVETVGVGQSETAVANMVDSFLLLTLARTGDQLQGIKKGVLELADVIAVNKADGPHERDARSAARELAGALRLMHPADAPGLPRCCPAARGRHRARHSLGTSRTAPGAAGLHGQAGRETPRPADRLGLDDGPRRAAGPAAQPSRVRALAPGLEQQVRDGELTATLAAERILQAFQRPH